MIDFNKVSKETPFSSELPEWQPHPIAGAVWRAALVLAKHASGYGFLADAIGAAFGEEGTQARLKHLLERIDQEVKQHGRELRDLAERLRDAKHLETLMVAADRTQRTTDMRKVQRFGCVLGRAVVTEGKVDWEEVQAFIRELSELGERDLVTLEALYEADRDYRKPTDFPVARTIHHEQFFKNRRLNTDDHNLRCGRLYGYGLALPERGGVISDPAHRPFKVSEHGVRLVQMLREDTN